MKVFRQGATSAPDIQSAAAGATLGLEQQLLANDGQVGKNVLAVGYTNTGKVQGVSLGDGNVVEVYASGADFNRGVVLYREFMSLGEPICFTGLSNGAIILATQGFYGMSEIINGAQESPMPLLSYGLSFKETFFYSFRNCQVFLDGSNTNRFVNNAGTVCILNGPLDNVITMTDGAGVTVQGQENIELAPWEFRILGTEGNKEYRLTGEQPMMACHFAGETILDARLIMPLTNDGITWPRSGFVSALYDNTQVDFWTRDGVKGRLNSTAGTGVSPGSPIDFDAAVGVGTGAGDADYEPNGATRAKAIGLISGYSGADSAGAEASPLMPVEAMSQVIAQPFFIRDLGDGGNSGVAIASPYVGEAKVYSWNDTTKALDLAYTVPLDRGITVATRDDQNHPSAGLIANDGVATNTLVGMLNAGIVIADVPCTVVAQSHDSARQTIRTQGGGTTDSLWSQADETLMLGITPDTLRAEITQGTDGLLYKRTIAASGTDTWEIA